MTGGMEFQEAAEAPQESRGVSEVKEQLDRAAFEPEAAVEQTGDFKQAEALETSFVEAVEATHGADEVSVTPITLPVEEPDMKGSDEISNLPLPIPGPALEGNAEISTDAAREGSNEEISATPITLPKEDGDPRPNVEAARVRGADETDISTPPLKSDFDKESDWNAASKEYDDQENQTSETGETQTTVNTRPTEKTVSASRPEAATDFPSPAPVQAEQFQENNSAAAQEEGTPSEQLDALIDDSQAEDGFVMRDPDGSDGSPEIDLGGLENTESIDLSKPTDISDAYGPDSMKDVNRGDDIGNLGDTMGDGMVDGLETPEGLDGDFLGEDILDGEFIGEDILGGDTPGGDILGGDIFGGGILGGMGGDRPEVGGGEFSYGTDFKTGDDLAGIAGAGRTGISEGDDKPADGSDSVPDSSSNPAADSNSSSGGKAPDDTNTSSDNPDGTPAGKRVRPPITFRDHVGHLWNRVASSSGPDKPEGAGYTGPKGTPNPDGSTEGGGTLSTEELNEIVKNELEKIGYDAEETGPPPDLSEELGSGLDPLINWGDDGEDGDEEFVGSSHLDVDITPSDPPDMAGGGEGGVEDTDGSSDGFEDIDP